ncbi:unnamed protein product [Prorocentrum cordatum]|uniref:PSI domain-containing protein n=1 Tax=Prorocentrum cordatum TaxID=2364126 RepID=A0ABN9QXP1_9DINO|nr:unnamed protein product [Polarella glacialis]
MRAAMIRLVAFFALGRAAADECPWHGCNNADYNDCTYKCKSCDALHTYYPHSYDSYGDCVHETCKWDDDYWEDWYASMIIGTIIGVIISTITLVLASCPVCCGVMKDKPLKAFACVLALITIPLYFLPYIAAKQTTVGLVEDICGGCSGGCTQEEKTELEDTIDGYSIFIAYTFGYGFAVLILAGITHCLTCCICCPCCGPLTTSKPTPVQPYSGAPQPAVMGQVLGQPVGSAAAVENNKLAT